MLYGVFIVYSCDFLNSIQIDIWIHAWNMNKIEFLAFLYFVSLSRGIYIYRYVYRIYLNSDLRTMQILLQIPKLHMKLNESIVYSKYSNIWILKTTCHIFFYIYMRVWNNFQINIAILGKQYCFSNIFNAAIFIKKKIIE